MSLMSVDLFSVWIQERSKRKKFRCYVQSRKHAFSERLVLHLYLCFLQIWIFFFFFLLKLSAVCTFWIVLMCWCQKWFLKNKKTSLACISAQKAIWKAPATTLPNTLKIIAKTHVNNFLKLIATHQSL